MGRTPDKGGFLPRFIVPVWTGPSIGDQGEIPPYATSSYVEGEYLLATWQKPPYYTEQIRLGQKVLSRGGWVHPKGELVYVWQGVKE